MIASLDSLRLKTLGHHQLLVLLYFIDLVHGFINLVQSQKGLAVRGWTLVLNGGVPAVRFLTRQLRDLLDGDLVVGSQQITGYVDFVGV